MSSTDEPTWDDIVFGREGRAPAMTEDPREFGLTAADLRTAADRLYPPGDSRLARAEGTPAEAAEWGRIRSRLRSLADAIDPDEPADDEPWPHSSCAVCGGRVGVFQGYDGWRHFRGEGTAADPVEFLDTGHEAAP